MPTQEITGPDSAHMLAHPGVFYPIPCRTDPRTPPRSTPFTQMRSRTLTHDLIVLPATEYHGRISPYFPGSHACYGSGEGLLLLAKTRNAKPSRAIIGSHGFVVGDFVTLRHDQTGSKIGDYYIVGIVIDEPEGFTMCGSVPSKALPVAVFK